MLLAQAVIRTRSPFFWNTKQTLRSSTAVGKAHCSMPVGTGGLHVQACSCNEAQHCHLTGRVCVSFVSVILKVKNRFIYFRLLPRVPLSCRTGVHLFGKHLPGVATRLTLICMRSCDGGLFSDGIEELELCVDGGFTECTWVLVTAFPKLLQRLVSLIAQPHRPLDKVGLQCRTSF